MGSTCQKCNCTINNQDEKKEIQCNSKIVMKTKPVMSIKKQTIRNSLFDKDGKESRNKGIIKIRGDMQLESLFKMTSNEDKPFFSGSYR